MTTDDAFAATLRQAATATAPAIAVDTTPVVPLARRRRDRRRSAVALSFGVLAFAGVGVTQAVPSGEAPAVVAHETPAPATRGIEPAISAFDAVTPLADDTQHEAGAPPGHVTALTGTLGGVGVAALAMGAAFAVRSRRYAVARA